MPLKFFKFYFAANMDETRISTNEFIKKHENAKHSLRRKLALSLMEFFGAIEASFGICQF
jgi:hypothetical protein